MSETTAAREPESKLKNVVQYPFRIQVGGRLMEGKIKADFLKAPFEGMKFLLPGDSETDEIKLEDIDIRDRAEKLQQILIEQRVSKTVYIGDDFPVQITLRMVDEAMAADVIPEDWEVPKTATQKWIGTFEAKRTLASVIELYGGKEIGKSFREKFDFVGKMIEPVFGHLVDEYNLFLAEVRDLLRPRNLGVALGKS